VEAFGFPFNEFNIIANAVGDGISSKNQFSLANWESPAFRVELCGVTGSRKLTI